MVTPFVFWLIVGFAATSLGCVGLGLTLRWRTAEVGRLRTALNTSDVDRGRLEATLATTDKMLALTTANEVQNHTRLLAEIQSVERNLEHALSVSGAVREHNRELTKMLSEAYAHQRLVLERVVAPEPIQTAPTLTPDKWIEQMETGGLWKDGREVVQEQADREEALRPQGRRDGSVG